MLNFKILDLPIPKLGTSASLRDFSLLSRAKSPGHQVIKYNINSLLLFKR